MPVRPDPTTQFDLFISYARSDNSSGMVSRLVEEIEAEHGRFSPSNPLSVFFDTSTIKPGQLWPDRIREGLRQSKVMLAVVSEAYFQSEWCRREWEEYLRVEQARRFPGDALTPIFIVHGPKELGDRLPAHVKAWWEDLEQRAGIEVQSFWPRGLEALRENEVRERLAMLCGQIDSRSEHARRLAAAPRNLRLRNPNFVGRVAELADLRTQLSNYGAVGLCAVSGIGGIGKTSIALEYAYRFRAEYLGGQFEVDMSSIHESGLLGERLVSIARDHLGAPIPREAPSEDQHRMALAVFNALPSHTPALLILDNLDEADAKLVSVRERGRVLPSPDKVHVIVTTRLGSGALGKDIHAISVDRLSAGEALDVLFNYRAFARRLEDPLYANIIAQDDAPHPPPPDGRPGAEDEWKCALAIANKLGRHTLATAMVGAYLGVNADITYHAFLRELEQRGIGLALDIVGSSEDVKQVIEHPQTMIDQLLGISLERLATKSPVAIRLLDYAAFLSADCVAASWLGEMARADDKLGGALQPAPFGPDPLADALRRLADLRYLTGEQSEALQMHRVLQEVVRRRIKPDDAAWIDQMILTTVHEFGARVQSGYVTEELASHLKVLVALAELWLPGGHAEAARLASALSAPLAQRGEWLNARRLARRGLEIFERLAAQLPDDVQAQRDLSVSLERLGDLARAAGRPDEARGHYQRGLEIRERLAAQLPDDVQAQRDLSVSLYQIGMLAAQTGDEKGAVANLMRCRDVLRAVKARGMWMDPAMERLLQQLEQIFGGS